MESSDVPVRPMAKFQRWDFYSPIEKRLKIVFENNTPFITWPNGVPCYEANMYMHSQLEASRSLRVKGGTLRTYANQIIHLVNYCHKNSIFFSQLTDDRFSHFIHGLQAERNQYNELKRNNNTIRNIGKRCLRFLVFIQTTHDLSGFIGKDKKNRITIIEKEYINKYRSGKKWITEITHRSIPTTDATTRKLPASESDMLKVWKYINAQPDSQKVHRDRIIYQLLEQTGARRSELHFLSVKNVEDAIKSSEHAPYLKIKTLKTRTAVPRERSFPVTHELLAVLNYYIRRVRKKIIKHKLTINGKKDHDYLLVSLTTGEPLQSDTTTAYMREWAISSGVTGEVTPQLFRHGFITNKLKELILQHKINNEDDFRRSLLNTTAFKIKLQQWTGHTVLSSLDTYINIAFSELSGFGKTLSTVILADAVKLLKQSINQIQKELINNQISSTEAINSINLLLNAFTKDLTLASVNACR